jgi:hypothetical protein
MFEINLKGSNKALIQLNSKLLRIITVSEKWAFGYIAIEILRIKSMKRRILNVILNKKLLLFLKLN